MKATATTTRGPNAFQRINANMRKLGLPVKLRQGRGYLYFTYDSDALYDTHSVYWNDLRGATDAQIASLTVEGIEFANAVRSGTHYQ